MNYYEVLEIDPSSSTEDIERAFRRLARQVHPDLSAGDRTKAEARMKQLNEIRDTLTDPVLRAGYDERLRRERERAQAAAPPAPDEVAASATPERPWGPMAARRGALSRAPWFLFVLGASTASALLWHWRHDRRWSAPPSTEAAPAGGSTTAPEPAAETSPAPSRPAKAQTSVRTRPRTRNNVVRVGSTVDEVFRVLGPPERVQPGKQSGDATLFYGALELEIKNGRVTGGDAAALR
jgi:hypothetical protein